MNGRVEGRASESDGASGLVLENENIVRQNSNTCLEHNNDEETQRTVQPRARKCLILRGQKLKSLGIFCVGHYGCFVVITSSPMIEACHVIYESVSDSGIHSEYNSWSVQYLLLCMTLCFRD